MGFDMGSNTVLTRHTDLAGLTAQDNGKIAKTSESRQASETHQGTRDPDTRRKESAGCWLQPGPVSATVGTWGANWQSSLFLCL